MKGLRIGIDIGGTFVDAILFDQNTGAIRLEKALTTPQNPSIGVFAAIDKLAVDLADVEVVVHGTTLGLNAIIERRGAATGIVTNAGFRDIFELGRGDVPRQSMYDLHYRRPEPLVRRRRIAEVPMRLNAAGEIAVALDEEALARAVSQLVEEQGIESLAVCALHAYKNPQQEQRIAALVNELFPDLYLSVSNQVICEYREYERTCTTVLDAYIRPIFEKYIDQLALQLSERGFGGNFLIMRSSGGAMTAEAAKRKPLDSVMSGPAGGIIGAAYLAGQLGLEQVLTMDFGGTSLDICVIDKGEAVVVHETRLQHLPVLIPTYDLRCIGAGGGSIAWLEEGMLRLGPHSAGADPGPIAYQRGGGEPTLTDAALTLGFIDPDNFLKGQLPLSSSAAYKGIDKKLGRVMGSDVVDTAAGIFAVLIAQTEGAVREVTVEQGKDPREFSILAFGGAGPLIAPLLALEMAIPEIIIPNVPAAFSAWGMLMADIATDISRTLITELDASVLPSLQDVFHTLEAQARQSLAAQGIAPAQQLMIRNLELRYRGQEHTLKVQVGDVPDYDAIRSGFDTLHERRYGHRSEQSIELVTIRITGVGRMRRPQLKKQRPSPGVERTGGRREAYCFRESALREFHVIERHCLYPGDCIEGPAIIDEGTSSTVFYTGQLCLVDDFGHLRIRSAQ